MCFLSNGRDEARVGRIGRAGCAIAELPGTGCRRRLRPAAALVVVVSLRGGQHCHRTTAGAAANGWRPEQQR